MHPHYVLQRVLGPPSIIGSVSKQHPGAPHSEQGVGYEHGALIAGVPVKSDVLCGHYQGSALCFPS